MHRRDLVKASLAAVCVVMCAQLALCQATAAGSSTPAADSSVALAAYDVVSVKPVDPATDHSFKVLMNGLTVRMGFLYTPDGVHWGGVTVSNLIRDAYGGAMKLPNEDSVTGLPGWAKSEIFEVQGKMSDAQAAAFAKLGKDEQQEQREVMLRALLADRFKLKVHREPKQVADYELIVAKGGPKMKEGDAPNPNGPKTRDGKAMTGSYLAGGAGKVTAQAYGMEALANFLGQQSTGVGRMVNDKTGLTGKYSFTLNWTPDASGDDSGPSIFTALEEQLGLKLQPGTGTINTVVVDHVERPTQD
jgi:uncharacterized protein (TIGR03435 family)